MTREEVIEILKDLWRTKHSMYLEADIRKALEMAILALEQELKWITVISEIRSEFDEYEDTDLIKAKYVRQIIDKYRK